MFIVWSAGDKIQSASRSRLNAETKKLCQIFEAKRKCLARRDQKLSMPCVEFHMMENDNCILRINGNGGGAELS
jgi:hypothetical protein